MARPEHIFLFDMTRTRSHLTFRYLSTHPDIVELWHPFAEAALFGPENYLQHFSNYESVGSEGGWAPTAGKHHGTYAEATQAHLDAVKAVKAAQEKGKILVAKEHCQIVLKQETLFASIHDTTPVPYDTENPTYIHDDLFASLTPVFIIRHPVFSIRSNYTIFGCGTVVPAESPNFRALTEVSLQRRLFDHFYQKLGRAPIVVDGEDVVWRTAEVGKALCEKLGLGETQLSDSWKPVPQEARHYHEGVRSMMAMSDDSTGIIRDSDTRPEVDVEKEKLQWVEKFGQEDAGELVKVLERNLPHYEYLARFKI